MESQELKAKIFTTSTFYKHLKVVVTNFSELQKSRKTGNVSKYFSEKIMLAVSQVNGCRYCSYLHTKNAIDAGASEDEMNSLLNGELGELGNDESVALMFAQHYADTDGNPDKETYEKFVAHYGEQKATDIMATIRVIMAGNIHGISVDALQSRFKGKKMKDSKLQHELGIFFGVFLIPVVIIQVWFEKLFKKKKDNKFNNKHIDMKKVKNVSLTVMLIAFIISGATSFAQKSVKKK